MEDYPILHSKESLIKSIRETIKGMESLLIYRKRELKKDPNSSFRKGAVETLTEYIEELKEELNKLESEDKNEIS